MGDMADWVNDSFDEDEQWATNWPLPKRCRYCGAGDLAWGQRNGEWRLVTSDGVTHECKAYHAPAPRIQEDEPY